MALSPWGTVFFVPRSWLNEKHLPIFFFYRASNSLSFDFYLHTCVRSKFSNTRCWFGWFLFNFFSSQVVTTGTSFNISGKTRVSAYKGDTADDISKPSIFLCRHRTISTSESRLTTYYSSHILSMHLRVVYAVTKSISSLIFISLRLRSARTETRSTI